MDMTSAVRTVLENIHSQKMTHSSPVTQMFWAETGSKGLVVMAQSSWFQACWESVNWSAAGGKSGHQMLTSCFGKQLQLWEAEKEKGPNYKEEQLKDKSKVWGDFWHNFR